jgi:hypothetical protein
MMLFIDTEFADQTARELVSIGMVSQDGRFEFYAERDPLPVTPSDFVRAVVYPLLDRGDRSRTDDEMSKQLHAFFDRVKEESRHDQVLVAYDYVADAMRARRRAHPLTCSICSCWARSSTGRSNAFLAATDKQPHADTTRSSMRG